MKLSFHVPQFLADLYSGKLHREFHYGPDKSEEEKSSEKAPAAAAAVDDNQGPDISDNEVDTGEGGYPDYQQRDGRERRAADPPESQFQHLGPSRNRYTLLHDEF